MSLGKYLRQLREERGLTLQEAAKSLDIDWSSLRKREVGKTRVRAAEFPLFAKLYGVPVSSFEQAATGRRAVPRSIPVINRAPAGQVVDYSKDQCSEGEVHAAFEYIERDATTQGERLFSVIVVGDSMEPTLYAGDYIVFDPIIEGQEYRLKNGAIVFIRFSRVTSGGECCLARAAWDGDLLILSKDNRKYPSMTIPADSVAQIAVAIQRRTGRF